MEGTIYTRSDSDLLILSVNQYGQLTDDTYVQVVDFFSSDEKKVETLYFHDGTTRSLTTGFTFHMTRYNYTVSGTPYEDTFIGSNIPNYMEMMGGAESDTYYAGLGVTNITESSGSNDTLIMPAGITSSDIFLSSGSNRDLVVYPLNGQGMWNESHRVVVKDFFNSVRKQIEEVRFQDGSSLELSGGLSLVVTTDHTLVGTRHNDVLTGDDRNNELHGYRGDDYFQPKLGHDWIYSEGGYDTLKLSVASYEVTLEKSNKFLILRSSNSTVVCDNFFRVNYEIEEIIFSDDVRWTLHDFSTPSDGEVNASTLFTVVQPSSTSTATRTPTPSSSFTPTPTGAPTSTPTPSPTSSNTPSVSLTSTLTKTSTPTSSPTSSKSLTSTSTKTATQTPTSSDTPSKTSSLSHTSTPTSTSTRTASPAGTPSAAPSVLLGLEDVAFFVKYRNHAIITGGALVVLLAGFFVCRRYRHNKHRRLPQPEPWSFAEALTRRMYFNKRDVDTSSVVGNAVRNNQTDSQRPSQVGNDVRTLNAQNYNVAIAHVEAEINSRLSTQCTGNSIGTITDLQACDRQYLVGVTFKAIQHKFPRHTCCFFPVSISLGGEEINTIRQQVGDIVDDALKGFVPSTVLQQNSQ